MSKFRLVLSLPGVFSVDRGLEFFSETLHALDPDSYIIKDAIGRLDSTQTAEGVRVVRLEQQIFKESTWVWETV